MADDVPETLEGQKCPMCGEDKLTLLESSTEVPYFGRVYLFSMSCSACKYHQADCESEEQKEPAKYTLEVSNEADMSIRIVKSSQATVKIPHITTITPGTASNGYITNVEGLLTRVKKEVEMLKETEEDEDVKQKAKNMLKKLQQVMWGQESLKIIIEDPTGNSAIISEKAVKEPFKAKKGKEE